MAYSEEPFDGTIAYADPLSGRSTSVSANYSTYQPYNAVNQVADV